MFLVALKFIIQRKFYTNFKIPIKSINNKWDIPERRVKKRDLANNMCYTEQNKVYKYTPEEYMMKKKV
jgi:hypothetical protein